MATMLLRLILLLLTRQPPPTPPTPPPPQTLHQPPPPPQRQQQQQQSLLETSLLSAGEKQKNNAMIVLEQEMETIIIMQEEVTNLLSRHDVILCRQHKSLERKHGEYSNNNNNTDDRISLLLFKLPFCSHQPETSTTTTTIRRKSSNESRKRWLLEETEKDDAKEDVEETVQDDDDRLPVPWLVSDVLYSIGALGCVILAALAAGLTLGLLGLDPLVLLIKERAGKDEIERHMAKQLLPIVQQHHRLLVTLLLLNALANEALPLFLEAIVSPAMAVLISVTLVLFFGEIIPSAVFTGPNQLIIATRLLPLVQFIMWLAYPIAYPIAKLLDTLLHETDDDDDDDNTQHQHDKNGANNNHCHSDTTSTSAAYTRGELTALIRIQYEERLAKRRRKRRHNHKKNQMMLLHEGGDHVGALDVTPTVNSEPAMSIRATVNHATTSHNHDDVEDEEDFYPNSNRREDSSLRHDEILMVEGALHMRTKIALDVYTPLRKVFRIPSDMVLTETNLVYIYAAGYTRVPVHQPGHPNQICGILMTRHLIVISADTSRSVSTLPMRKPQCVPPNIPLVHLLNLLQHGGRTNIGGHLALVCAQPKVAEAALAKEDGFVPEEAGLMGIITLEDVLEMLLQEQIYDEMDKHERQEHQVAMTTVRHWRGYVRRQKVRRVVAEAMEANESTRLLPA